MWVVLLSIHLKKNIFKRNIYMIKNVFVKIFRENKMRLNHDIIDHFDAIKQLDLYIIFIYNLTMYFSV